MTVRLELRPEIEANLAAQARARGVTLDVYLQNVVEDLARSESEREVGVKRITVALDKLAELGRDTPELPDSALTRESIYKDRD
jgi:hypothetical protein